MNLGKIKRYGFWLLAGVKLYRPYYQFLSLFLGSLLVLLAIGSYQISLKPLPTITLQLDSNRSTISAITIETQPTIVRYAKANNNLWLRENADSALSYHVPIDRMNELLRFVSTPFVAIFVEDNPTNLAYYGLDKEHGVSLSVSTLKNTTTLVLGSYAPNGTDIFVLYNNKVYRTPMTAFYTMGAINGL